jgi:hypothetical protein
MEMGKSEMCEICSLKIGQKIPRETAGFFVQILCILQPDGNISCAIAQVHALHDKRLATRMAVKDHAKG